MTLALKHHHKQRIKNNRIKYHIVGMNENKRHIGKAIKTPSYCNCIYCRKLIEKRLIDKKLSEIDKVNYD